MSVCLNKRKFRLVIAHRAFELSFVGEKTIVYFIEHERGYEYVDEKYFMDNYEFIGALK